MNDSPLKKYKWTKRPYSIHSKEQSSYRFNISSDYYTIYYSSTLNGTTLENPTLLQIAKSTYDSQAKINQLASTLSGKYFVAQGGSSAYPSPPSTTNLSTVYYGLGSGTYDGSYHGTSSLNVKARYMIRFSTGWSSVLSSDISAYPSNGYVGDDCYVYDGKLEDLVQDCAIVCSGAYTGTGTATTQSSPMTITIPHDPKIIFINPVRYFDLKFEHTYSTAYAPSRYIGLVFARANEYMDNLGFIYMSANSGRYSGKYDPVNRRFQWYVDESSSNFPGEAPLNKLNSIYGWIAIC